MTEFVKDELDIINHVGKIHIHNNDAKRPQGEMIWIPTYVWNRRLGHIRKNAWRNSMKMDFRSHLIFESFDICKPFLKWLRSVQRPKGWTCDLLEIIHVDVCDPLSVDCERWILLLHNTLIGEISRYIWIYPLDEKEVCKYLKMFK